MSDYDRIAGAIEYIVANADAQPSLAEVAKVTNLSPSHFQRLFTRWAGVSPKRFMQVLTVERAKRLLEHGRSSLLATSSELGLSSGSRLYDHFVTLEAVTPAQFRHGGQELLIRYGQADSPFGRAFLAMTDRGLLALSFLDHDSPEAALERLRAGWPGASLIEDGAGAGALCSRIFGSKSPAAAPLSVAVRGTNFQIAVWRALLAIPCGALASYGNIAAAIGRPSAVRAVGTAVGANPCAFVIPCHRVIRESGEIGGYRWGLTRKRAINLWEAAVTDGMLPEC